MRKMLMMCNSDPSGRLWRLACGQGDRSCAKARKAFAEKFGLGRNFLALNMHYFVAILRFVAIYALFGRLLPQKCFFGTTTVILGQEVHNL